MHTTTKRILLSASLAFCSSITAWAQSLSLYLGEQPTTTTSGDKVDVTYKGVNLKFLKNATTPGAYIYRNDNTYGDYSLYITSEKNIVSIEFEGVLSTYKGKTADVLEKTGHGTFTFSETGTSTWTGSSTSLTFSGASATTGYIIQNIRIWFEGDSGEGGGEEDLDILQRPGADVHYYSQGNNLPRDGRPVTLAVVSDTKFRETLQPYLLWKTQQGYHVEEIYADEVRQTTGKTQDDLALAIRERLMALTPRPSYVLLAGDCDEVPYFQPRTAMAGGQDAVTDLFYGEYSGDHFPEAAVGRFSANTVEQLQVQMDKTRYMAFIRPSEAGWMKQSLVVQGPRTGPDDKLATEKSVQFGNEFPKRWDGNTVANVNPNMYSQASLIKQYINQGCSQVSYLGHGGWNMWWGSNFDLTDINNLSNPGRYPVVLGLTCLTGSFQFYNCMAEAFMRHPSGGAVAYIGATRESWDGADNLFYYGTNNGYKSFDRPGYLRSLYHPDEEDGSQIARTIGDAFNLGKFASRPLGEYQPFRQFTEFFTLFGDPTYQPYITTPQQMVITAPKSATAGRSVAITTAPDAVVAISSGRKIIAVGLADSEGHITLKVPADAPAGECTLYSSAPFYNDLSTTIKINAGDGTDENSPAYVKPERVQYKDVVDVNTAAGYITNGFWGQSSSFGVGSPARYAMWAATNLEGGAGGLEFQHWLTSPDDTSRAIYLRNKYEHAAIITTTTAGTAAYVEVDWLHPCGQTEILGVYGSKTPYRTTDQAWNGEAGTKLGTLRKGDNNRLDIEGEWPYILLRAEDYEGYYGRAADDRNNVFIKQLTIGWNRLDDADVDRDGDIDLRDVETLRYILANDQTSCDADVNGDGRVTIADITSLISRLKK